MADLLQRVIDREDLGPESGQVAPDGPEGQPGRSNGSPVGGFDPWSSAELASFSSTLRKTLRNRPRPRVDFREPSLASEPTGPCAETENRPERVFEKASWRGWWGRDIKRTKTNARRWLSV
jgi:hypothetical protein